MPFHRQYILPLTKSKSIFVDGSTYVRSRDNVVEVQMIQAPSTRSNLNLERLYLA